MRFLMIVKASEQSEAGIMPSEGLLGTMMKYNEELMKAGVLLDLSGLQPSSKGTRISFSEGKISVIDGPFSETKELIAGYWLIEVNSRQEALDWAMRIPFVGGPVGDETVVELRQLFDIGDFPPSAAIEHARQIGQELTKH